MMDVEFTEADIAVELFKRGCFDFISMHQGKNHLKQKRALEILTDPNTVEFVYGGAAGGAKSWTGCAWLAMMCLTYPGTKWFIGREELKRLRDSTLVTFFKVCARHGIKRELHFKYHAQDNYLLFSNGSRIDLLDLKFLPADPMFERYGSVEYTGGWIEEAGEVAFEAYDTLKSRIGRQMNDAYGLLRKLFITCNPKKNWLYMHFYKPYKAGELKSNQQFLPALIQDNPHRESGYEDALRSISDAAKKQRLFLGNWEYDDDPLRLIEFNAIENLWTNEHVKGGAKYISADIALQGSDRFVLGVWDGLRLIDIAAVEKCRADELEQLIKFYAALHAVPRSNIVYDADGLGTYLKGYLRGAQPFHNNARPLGDENYKNLKTQCYYHLSGLINTHSVFIEPATHRDQLIEELEQVKRIETDDGKLQLIDKLSVRHILGRSPDLADMLMMRMYFEVKPKSNFSYRSSGIAA